MSASMIARSCAVLGGGASPCALVCVGLFLARGGVVRSDAPGIGAPVGLELMFRPAAAALAPPRSTLRSSGAVV